MDEPRYVDDPFADEVDLTPKTDFQKRLLALSGRKKFATFQTKKFAMSIEEHMGDWQPNMTDPPKFPKEYVEGILHWCEDQQLNNQARWITAELAVRMIRDKDRLGKWLTKHGAKPDAESGASSYGANF